MSEINMGSVYNANKEIMNNFTPITDPIIINKSVIEVTNWMKNKNQYFMLLNNENKDYTIFNVINHDWEECKAALKDCILNRGDLLEIEYIEETDAYEIWIRTSGENFVYYFFSYDNAVLEV